MADTWKSITFNEGAPLDPNDLNQLQTNLTQLFQDQKLLNNQLKTGSQSILLSVGSVKVTAIAGKAKYEPLPIDSKFKGVTPSFLVSIGSEIYDGDVVSVGVKNQDSDSPQISLVSNKARPYVVNYIAFLAQ